jgi:hypothetical protein
MLKISRAELGDARTELYSEEQGQNGRVRRLEDYNKEQIRILDPRKWDRQVIPKRR